MADKAAQQATTAPRVVTLHEQVFNVKQPTGQFFIHFILQVVAFAVAVAFGVFAIKSVQVGHRANGYAIEANEYSQLAMDQAKVANQLAFIAYCSSLLIADQVRRRTCVVRWIFV